MEDFFVVVPPAFRALLGAFFFGCNQILVRRLVDRASALTITVYINFWMSVISLLFTPILDSFEGDFTQALLFFIGVGFVGQATARYLTYASNQIIGVSRTSTIVAGSPIGAAMTGVFILGERPGISVWIGIGLVVVGLILLTSERGKGRFPLRDYTMAFFATAAFAITPYLRKGGLQAMNATTMGIVVSSLIANFSLIMTSRFLPETQRFRFDGSVILAAFPAGVLALAAALNFWTALRDGPITVISPLIRMTPIFVLILSAILLREHERITRWLVFATGIVVIGSVLVTSAS